MVCGAEQIKPDPSISSISCLCPHVIFLEGPLESSSTGNEVVLGVDTSAIGADDAARNAPAGRCGTAQQHGANSFSDYRAITTASSQQARRFLLHHFDMCKLRAQSGGRHGLASAPLLQRRLQVECRVPQGKVSSHNLPPPPLHFLHLRNSADPFATIRPLSVKHSRAAR